MECPDENRLLRFLGADALPELREQILRHLDDCASCRSVISVLAQSLPDAPATDAPPTVGSSLALTRGTKVGRYTIIEPIGVGGMGTVFRAADPILDRLIALKLVRTSAGGPVEAADRRTRLLAEARTLAQVTHPNIVSVFDAGTFEEHVFLVMELVEGATLRSWLESPRAWREVRDLFLASGAGLAAAHRLGIVHRDFKPENVLVDRDGRPKVGDFGLAHRAGVDDGARAAGAIFGTPVYMSPEQHEGLPPDARSDQFAFSAALHEALHGTYPFAGASRAELHANKRAGRLATPGPGSKVPAWLRRVVVRGLAPDPRARYPTLDALLEDMAPEARRRRRGAFALAAGVAGALVAAWQLGGPPAPRPCAAAERRLRGTWDADARRAVEAVGATSPIPYAAVTLRGAVRLLDAHAERWVAEHTTACEATRVYGDQSEAVLDQRMACLEERRVELAALGQLLASPTDASVERSIEAAAALRDPAQCASVAQLRGPAPAPTDPDARARIAAVREELARARVDVTLGRYREARERVDATLPAARATAFGQLLAEALLVRGEVLVELDAAEADAQLYEAALEAESSRHDLASVEAWILLVRSRLEHALRPEATLALRHARAALARVGDAPELSAKLAFEAGLLARREGAFAEALAQQRRALELWTALHGPDHPTTAVALNGLSATAGDAGDVAAAEAYARRGLEVRERIFGPDHPLVAASLNNLAGVHVARGALDEGLAAFRRVLALRERALGPDHPKVAMGLSNVGAVLLLQGKHAEALPLLRRAYETRLRVLGPTHPDLPVSLHNIGEALAGLGRLDEALASQREALARHERDGRATHPDVAACLSAIGRVLLRQGHARDAAASHRRALKIREAALGPVHAAVGHDLAGLGAAELALDHPGAAIPLLERAIALWDASATEPVARAEARRLLDRALERQGRGRARARARR